MVRLSRKTIVPGNSVCPQSSRGRPALSLVLSGFQLRCGWRSRSLKTRGFRNTPSGEPDESFPEEIRVLDPRHPLYGRSFRVVGRTSHRGGNFLPSYEVEYRDRVTLLVPVATTEHPASSVAFTKLSMDALQDLLNMVDCIDYEHGTRSSLDDAAADPTTTDRQRDRRGSGGGLS